MKQFGGENVHPNISMFSFTVGFAYNFDFLLYSFSEEEKARAEEIKS